MSKTKLLLSISHELGFFKRIQNALFKLTTLIYHNLNKILWIDLDVLKKFGFGTIIFHTNK